MEGLRAFRPMKSNDLGELLEVTMKEACALRECTLFRLHTVRSFRGVSNPCDFILMDKEFTALLECKATNDESFSCSAFYQLHYFESAVKFSHLAYYGVVVYFHSAEPKYVYASDQMVLENRKNRRPIRVANVESYELISDSLSKLLDLLRWF